MLSEAASDTIFTDFSAKGISIDLVERLNSEMFRDDPKRAPARDFVAASRASVLRQTAACHKARGGDDPMQPSGARNAKQPEGEILYVHPLLVRPRAVPRGPQQADGSPDGPGGGDEDGEASNPLDLGLGTGDHPGISVRASDVTSEAWVDARVDAPHSLDHMVEASRRRPSYINSLRAPDNAQPKKKRGLSPFMLAMNLELQSSKRAKGAALTDNERHTVTATMQERQRLMTPAERAVQKELYSQWRETPAVAPTVAPREYHPMHTGGDSTTPVCAEELLRRHQRHGWPEWQRVTDPGGTEGLLTSDRTINYNDYSETVLHGVGRWPRNVPRAIVRDVRMHSFLECGIHNYMVS